MAVFDITSYYFFHSYPVKSLLQDFNYIVFFKISVSGLIMSALNQLGANFRDFLKDIGFPTI